MWKTNNDQLYKKYTFKDFNEAMHFINQVAKVANSHSHHPTIHNTWNTVELWLTTHDEGDTVTDKDHALARDIDKLLEQPKQEKHPSSESSKESKHHKTPGLKQAKLYADGGSRGNPGPSASGYVVMDLHDNVLVQDGIYLGVTTNNQAEYLSLKYGLEAAHKLGIQEISVFMDSMLVVNQMKGIFKVKNRDLWPIHEAIKELASKFKKVSYTHVPRELNKLADAAVNEALDKELKK